LIMGSGRFVPPKTLEVRLNDSGTRALAGDRFFLNVGTHAAIPSVPGLEAAGPLTLPPEELLKELRDHKPTRVGMELPMPRAAE
jgi:pyruvate/2-oxoglutarate dehydrogenase complex dihydrolipoamide dehydrogenase (E3) component